MVGKIDEVLDNHVYNAIAASYVIIMVATIVLNGTVILTFYRVRSLLTPASLPILSLALADFLLALTAMPVGIAANFSRNWFLGNVGCNWYAFSHTVVGLSSIVHHAVIAVETCRKITQPMTTSIGKRGMARVTLVVWGTVIIWGSMPLFGWSSYQPEGSGAVCSIKWKSTYPADAWYVILTFVLFLFAPLIVIVACYSVISHDLRRMAKKAKKEWGRNSQITIDRMAAKEKSMRTGVIMFVATFIAWMPYAVVSIMSAVGNPDKIPPLAFAIPALMTKTSAFINPMFSFFWYEKYRDGIKKMFTSQDLGRDDTVQNDFPMTANLKQGSLYILEWSYMKDK